MAGELVGVDIVEVDRIGRLVASGGDRFLRRWYSPTEIAYCRSKAVPSRHFAGRFAAKEAVVKVLPADAEQPLLWRWIEVTRSTGGAPVVRLSGVPRELATSIGIEQIAISVSHCRDYATAVALARYRESS